MSDVNVTQAAPQQKSALENLFQLYIHDFSEHWAGRADGELGEDGRFPAYSLDDYWTQETHVPLLFRRSGSLIGFALLNVASHSGLAVDRNVAEFFVARKHRRAGAGLGAAQAIFTRHPGQWEVSVARRNVAAVSFWRRAIAQCPLATSIEELDIATTAWNGPVIRFRIDP